MQLTKQCSWWNISNVAIWPPPFTCPYSTVLLKSLLSAVRFAFIISSVVTAINEAVPSINAVVAPEISDLRSRVVLNDSPWCVNRFHSSSSTSLGGARYRFVKLKAPENCTGRLSIAASSAAVDLLVAYLCREAHGDLHQQAAPSVHTDRYSEI